MLVTILVSFLIICSITDAFCHQLYDSCTDVLFPLMVACFVDHYDLVAAKWIIFFFYLALLCSYLVSWAQKFL